MILLFTTSIDDAWQRLYAWRSLRANALAAVSVAVQIGGAADCLLLLIQGVSEILKSWYMMRTGMEFEQKIGGEI